MHVRLLELAARQRDLVAAWQLLDRGWTRAMIDQRVRDHGWRVIHRGVYALIQSPLTQEQLLLAATLTAPGTFLSHASAGVAYGIYSFNARYQTVTRPGNGGPRRAGNVLVSHSMTLRGDTTIRDGVPITTGARAVIDLAPHLDDRAAARMFREALRLKVTTPHLLGKSLEKHRARRGTRILKELNGRYADIPYARARSDAEALAFEILVDAGVELPVLNARIAGEEADLTWRARRLIIEIDGPQFHQFADEDARKQAIWERAGYTVRRISSDRVYNAPNHLIGLVTAP